MKNNMLVVSLWYSQQSYLVWRKSKQNEQADKIHLPFIELLLGLGSQFAAFLKT